MYKTGLALIVTYVLLKILVPLSFNVAVRRAVDRLKAEHAPESIPPTPGE